MSPTTFSSLNQTTIEGSSSSMATATETVKPPPSKPPADTSVAETTETTTTAKKKDPRPYRITKELRLDLTDPMSLVQQLQAVAAGEGDEIPPVTVYVRVGEGKGVNPKEALEQFGSTNDMKGDYEVVAETSIKPFKDVSTEVKRKVSFS